MIFLECLSSDLEITHFCPEASCHKSPVSRKTRADEGLIYLFIQICSANVSQGAAARRVRAMFGPVI